MANSYVKIEVPDYRKIVDAVSMVRNGALAHAVGGSPSPATSTPLLNWQVVPDDEDPCGFVNVFLGFVLGDGTTWCLPAGDDAEKTWLPGATRYTQLEIPDVGANGTSGFVYWHCEKDANEKAVLPGTIAIAADEDAVVEAVAESMAYVVLAEIKWDSFDPCGYQVEQLYTSAIVTASPAPDTASDLEDISNKSIEDKQIELTSGELKQVRQLFGFEADDVVAYGLQELLKADPKSGVIAAQGQHASYELVVRVRNGDGTQRAIGYMPFGESDGEDPVDTEEEACQHDEPPGGGAGGHTETGESVPENDRQPPGGGALDSSAGTDRNHDNFPSKVGPCW